MSTYCGVCASDEYTSDEQLDNGKMFHVCSNPFHGATPRTWEPPSRSRVRLSSEGLGAALSIWDKLYECVPEGDEFVPYGQVEDVLAEKYPSDMQRLIIDYGHKWRDPNHPSTRYSASVYLGARLSELAREGLLEHQTGPATGKWAYNVAYEWWRHRQ